MRRAARILGRIFLGLVALIVVVVGAAYAVSTVKLRKRYTIPQAALIIPSDSASLARGRTLAGMYGCASCHTPTLGGQVMIDAFPFARIASANLTRGRGGVGAAYTDADWERAIRHGVRPSGEPLLIMPSKDFHKLLGDEDVRALIAYLKTVPPVDNAPPRPTLYPVGHAIHAFGGGGLVAAEEIDHAGGVTAPAPPPGATLAYGRYRGAMCQVCHGETLAGAASGPEPGGPPVPNITPGDEVGRWSEADFIRTMRTGTTPAGKHLDNKYMPWEALGQLGDDELRGIWMYLRSVPPVAPAKKG